MRSTREKLAESRECLRTTNPRFVRSQRQLFEWRWRSVLGIPVGLSHNSPKGKNNTAQGRDALVAHPGCRQPRDPTLKGSHTISRPRSAVWNPFRVRFVAAIGPRVRDQSVATLGCDV